MPFLFRLFVCIFVSGLSLYAYVNKHNALTELRMRLPVCTKELIAIQEENVRLQFAIEKFQSPMHLMELAKRPEFSHLKYPVVNEIINVDLDKDT